MKFEKIKSEKLHYEYDVVLLADEVEARIVKKVEDRAKTFKMSGFRQSHVPVNIVRKHVEDVVTSEALSELISKACAEIVKEAKIESLATKPMYNLKNRYEKGKDVELTVFVDAAPSFDLKPYDFKIEKVVPDVSENEVEEALQRLMKKKAVYEQAEDGYAVKAGDEVSFSAVPYNDGSDKKAKKFSNTVIIPDEIPEGMGFLPEFVSKKAGDAFEVAIKDVKYKIAIKSIKKMLSNISPDEYAKRRDFENIDELKSVIKQALEKEILDFAFVYHKFQILDKLAGMYKFELPQKVVDQEMKFTLARAKKDNEEEARKDPKRAKTEEQLRKELLEVVSKRCMLGYVLNKIAIKEHITVTQDEVSKEILKEIEAHPDEAEFILKVYKTNEDAYAYKSAEVLEQKVVEFLIGNVKYREIKKTRAEVIALVQKMMEE